MMVFQARAESNFGQDSGVGSEFTGDKSDARSLRAKALYLPSVIKGRF